MSDTHHICFLLTTHTYSFASINCFD